MHHELGTISEPLIGITECARQIGICHSTLSRQVKRGQVRSHGGKVRLSEVIYDRRHNLDQSIWLGRRRRDDVGSAAVHAVDGGAHRMHNGECGERYAPGIDDDAPIGPQPFHIGWNADLPLTRGLARRLGEMVGVEQPDDLAFVAYDLATTAINILQQEIARLKAKAGEPE
jgi:hypothetical protein